MKHLAIYKDMYIIIFSRKEVIQPQVPLLLPCYDFTPVMKHTVVIDLSCELA